MKKLLLMLLRFFVFAVVLVIGGIMIYDQIALDAGLEQTGFLTAIGLTGIYNGFTQNYERLGYYLMFYGSTGLFIFLSVALVLQMIPILGKILILLIAIVPFIAIILIVVGALIFTNTIEIPEDFGRTLDLVKTIVPTQLVLPVFNF